MSLDILLHLRAKNSTWPKIKAFGSYPKDWDFFVEKTKSYSQPIICKCLTMQLEYYDSIELGNEQSLKALKMNHITFKLEILPGKVIKMYLAFRSNTFSWCIINFRNRSAKINRNFAHLLSSMSFIASCPFKESQHVFKNQCMKP